MENNSTYLSDPKETKKEPRKFTFDHSYWSHDGSETTENGYLRPMTSHYTDQVSDATLCTIVISNCFKGLSQGAFVEKLLGYLMRYSATGIVDNQNSPYFRYMLIIDTKYVFGFKFFMSSASTCSSNLKTIKCMEINYPNEKWH